MISRTAADWRSLPTLTVKETAELVGLSAQTVEAHVLPQLEVRLIGRTRMVVTASLRRWLGEDAEHEKRVEALERDAVREARRMVRGIR